MRISLSAAKKTIILERNTLSERVIKAYECLKARWRNQIISVTMEATRKRKASATEEDEEQAGLPN
jgi:hypothetical protein